MSSLWVQIPKDFPSARGSRKPPPWALLSLRLFLGRQWVAICCPNRRGSLGSVCFMFPSHSQAQKSCSFRLRWL